MGKLTTHVLDTANGLPGKEIKVNLYQFKDNTRTLLISTVTNDDGRCDSPLLEGGLFEAGGYELEFFVADYYAQKNQTLSKPAFLDDIVLRFYVADAAEHYHVPLLVSPYGYSTYRGS